MNIEICKKFALEIGNFDSRERQFLYPRMYLMNYMRDNVRTVKGGKMSYRKIGLLFGGKDHATVLNNCKNHINMTSVGFEDDEYKELTSGIAFKLRTLKIDFESVENDIVNCFSMIELKIIQNKVRSNYYY